MISCELLEKHRALDLQVSQPLHHRMHIGGVGLFHRHEVQEKEVPLLLVFNPIFNPVFLSGISFKKPPSHTANTLNPERNLAISSAASHSPPQHIHPISSSR
ncbi:hypothetical protein AG0111_0g11388 [Alternaria gaisen]|uniref:Uncharacterized protein n=1 Tax=Alternaria gaisen TaxID=167740 RepID=A0ACB6F7G4_9PLEO|nr:hypothetical protein AG0111_0g11388 [Alternaria gaisen]